MFTQLKKYSQIFLAIQSAGIAKDIQLRGNFTLTLIGSLCYFYLHLISFKLIISRFRFPGWETGQLWILLFTFEIFTYLAFFFFWRGLQHTPREIGTGTFDVLLSKPFSSRFMAFFRNGSLHNLVSAIFGAVYLVFALFQYQIHTTLLGIVLYILGLIVSLWVFHCISVLFVCLNFKYGFLPGTSGVAFEVQEIYKYPATIFSSSGFLIHLLVIPLSLLTTIPAASLLLKPISIPLLATYLSSLVVLSIWSQHSWSSALRHYSSASS